MREGVVVKSISQPLVEVGGEKLSTLSSFGKSGVCVLYVLDTVGFHALVISEIRADRVVLRHWRGVSRSDRLRRCRPAPTARLQN
jgi:hypothetical protein